MIWWTGLAPWVFELVAANSNAELSVANRTAWKQCHRPTGYSQASVARHREASAEGMEQTGASEAVSGREATDVSPAPIAPLRVSLSASCIVAMGVICVMLCCDGLILHNDFF